MVLDKDQRGADNPWYTREDLRVAGDGSIERGLLCKKCGLLIPQFADLSPGDEARIYSLIRAGRNAMATQELAAATGCNLGWAKLWVQHRGKPEAIYSVPCPYCGKEMRSSEAKQCRYCLRDWHDETNIVRLGTNVPWTTE